MVAVGARSLRLVEALGHASAFFRDLVRHTPAALRRFDLSLAQIYAIGNLSLVIIVMSGAAVGGVLALQAYYALDRYGAAESVGLLVALSLLRELGPVLTALLYAGRAGTSLTAEIGL
ncbi:MAG: ABC transporter permease, partial [Burkholderiaceae bacterium]|nr:ABC transporter permease [Burkholderiaceae bacterium]